MKMMFRFDQKYFAFACLLFTLACFPAQGKEWIDLLPEKGYGADWKKREREGLIPEIDFAKLTPRYALPEILADSHGNTIRTVRDWQKRKGEIRDILDEDLLGDWPDVPERKEGRLLNTETLSDGWIREEREVYLRQSDLSATHLTYTLTYSTAKAPCPVYLLFSRRSAFRRGWVADSTDRGYALAIAQLSDWTPWLNCRRLTIRTCFLSVMRRELGQR